MTRRSDTEIAKELAAIKAIGAELIQRTSRLEEELAPVQEQAPRKGRAKKPDIVQTAIDKRNRRIRR